MVAGNREKLFNVYPFVHFTFYVNVLPIQKKNKPKVKENQILNEPLALDTEISAESLSFAKMATVL